MSNAVANPEYQSPPSFSVKINSTISHSAEDDILGLIKNERLMIEQELDSILGNIPRTSRASIPSSRTDTKPFDKPSSKRDAKSTEKKPHPLKYADKVKQSDDLRMTGISKAIQKLQLVLKEKEMAIQDNILFQNKLSCSIRHTKVLASLGTLTIN